MQERAGRGEFGRGGGNNEEKVKLGEEVGEVGVGLGLHGGGVRRGRTDWPMFGVGGTSFD